jgi:hypothetical protein
MKTHYTKSSKINGNGLYAAESIKKGELIDYVHGDIHVFRKFTPAISKRMLNWIGIGRYSWINTDKSAFRFINHSCSPNTAIVTKRKVIAIKSIAIDEELTMDYSLTEAEPGWEIQNCSCQAKQCRKTITSITELSQSVYRRNKEHIPPNFQKIYESTKNR